MAKEVSKEEKAPLALPSNVTQTTTEAKPQGAVVIPIDPRNDDMGLKYFDKDFIYDVMSVPTKSRMEWRMVVYIILFCRRNNIKYEFDSYGNIYLTKGELAEGEYYPCVTSHLDTVQDYQVPYILAGVNLPIKTSREANGHHKIYVEGIGIGADDKGGVCISLAMFKHHEKLKACFFLEEEIGCVGSNKLEKDWFNDVGYVIGYDSPELNRAAWACNGQKLFSYNFYEKHLKKVCDKWGLTRFESEPYTDVKVIREKTNLICMNFGNGGYLAHDKDKEYSIVEEMDNALGMGKEIIDELGCNRYTLTPSTEYSYANLVYESSNGEKENIANYDDSSKLRKLGKYASYSGTYGSGTSYSSGTTTTITKKREDEIRFETLEYIVKRYDAHIDAVQGEILDAVKEICKENTIDFGLFEEAIKDRFKKEIKF